jgi:hypothetical protein
MQGGKKKALSLRILEERVSRKQEEKKPLVSSRCFFVLFGVGRNELSRLFPSFKLNFQLGFHWIAITSLNYSPDEELKQFCKGKSQNVEFFEWNFILL